MRAQYILDQLRMKPFTPLRIFLTDGSHYDVRHPDMVIVTARRLVIAIGHGSGSVAEDVAWCDPVHVTRIEPLPATLSSVKSKRKKR